MKSTTEIIKESEKAEGKVLDILIKNGWIDTNNYNTHIYMN